MINDALTENHDEIGYNGRSPDLWWWYFCGNELNYCCMVNTWSYQGFECDQGEI